MRDIKQSLCCSLLRRSGEVHLMKLIHPGMAEDDGTLGDGEFALSEKLNPNERLVFNICGAKYEIMETTFQRYPNTLLADRDRRAQYWDEKRKEFYLDRNRACFKAVLTYYQSQGVLVRPDSVPAKLFTQELEFYDIQKKKVKPKRPMPKNKLQKRIWKLFEYPDTSNAAHAIAWFSCSIVLLSIITFCIETLPTFEKDLEDESKQGKTKQEEVFFNLEATCITWFTLEYLVRLMSSPCKHKFVIGALNIIDLVAIVPFYISFALDEDSNVSSVAVLRAVRLVRVFRIFKLSRYSKGLQILGLTLKASMTELGLLVFFLSVGVILFSSAVYYAEMESNREVFQSIPHAFWWAIITMTTVGYGDMYPITFGGKVVGSLCAFAGILAIALPVPVIVANFEHFYNKHSGSKETLLKNKNTGSRYDRLRRLFKSIRKRQKDNQEIQV